ncbi:hypothetical protein K445DRAFT_176150 [Daldinia sp. EC12]|nr:hypothetical protein K445DRAFT_176150 [Daldinia sp. EC12]
MHLSKMLSKVSSGFEYLRQMKKGERSLDWNGASFEALYLTVLAGDDHFVVVTSNSTCLLDKTMIPFSNI